MKTMNKISGLLAAILLFGLAPNVNAQDNFSISQEITVKAAVFANLAFDDANKRDLDFSSLSQGIAKTILPNALSDVETTGPTTGDETSGIFEITGPTGASIDISYTILPAALSGPTVGEGAALLPIVYTSNYHVLTGTDEGTDEGTAVTVAVAGSNTIEDGKFPAGGIRVYLGGTVTPGALQAPGSYTTTVTLQAIFN